MREKESETGHTILKKEILRTKTDRHTRPDTYCFRGWGAAAVLLLLLLLLPRLWNVLQAGKQQRKNELLDVKKRKKCLVLLSRPSQSWTAGMSQPVIFY